MLVQTVTSTCVADPLALARMRIHTLHSLQPEDPVDYLAHWLLKYLAVEEKNAKVRRLVYFFIQNQSDACSKQ